MYNCDALQLDKIAHKKHHSEKKKKNSNKNTRNGMSTV